MAKRVLIVTGQKPITNIKTKSGGQSTLYEVYATDEAGEIVEESLRSFAELEEGAAIEYEIEPYNHPQYGTSYTLHPPKRNTQKRLREAEEQLAQLVEWAKTKGYDPNTERPSEDTAEEKKPQPVPAPENDELDAKFGSDPPEGFGD